jgi:hypothetical protein
MLFCSLFGALALSACSSSGSSTAASGGSSSANGGSSGNGGASASGGASVASGGAGTGGAIGSGGSATSGGVISAGGAATGGASSAGGSVKGGATSNGGASFGGASATGGATNGGTSASGGSGVGGAATGGATAGGTGGKTGATGGTTGQGGATGTGGGSGGTGGTTGTTTCAGRVLSLSANATGTAADTAYSHVEADLKTDLPIGNANRTIEFWAYIKTTDWVGEHNELYYYGSAGTAMAFGLDFGTNPVTGSTTNHATLNPFTNGGFTLDSTDDLGITSSSNQWVHIAMTWNGTVLLVYVNGLPKITVNAIAGSGVTALATVQSVLYIGCNPTNKNCFNGEFAEFRVWNVARSAADILANYNKPAVGNETGLVAYWKFDDAAGATIAADSVTTAGHTAHPGTLKADTTAHDPTFIAPATALPLVCQ